MKDIAPELLDAVQQDFNSLYGASPLIKELLNLIEDGKATYKEANEYAIAVGNLLVKAFQRNLSSEVLPDGKMYYNIAETVVREPLENNHKLVAEICAVVQTTINKKAGLGLKGIEPGLNEELVKSMTDKIVSSEQFDDVKYMLREPVVNFTQSVVDDAVRVNAEFQYKSGLSPRIVRRSTGHCCEWCNRIAGTYKYPDVPKDVYRRHNFCKCTVEYVADGIRENVHTKQDTTRKSRIEQIEELQKLDREKLESRKRKRR